jgi:hypothetical protein
MPICRVIRHGQQTSPLNSNGFLTRFVFALTVAVASDAQTAAPPVLSIPRIAKPPVIDGILSPSEWNGAAATCATGFSVSQAMPRRSGAGPRIGRWN